MRLIEPLPAQAERIVRPSRERPMEHQARAADRGMGGHRRLQVYRLESAETFFRIRAGLAGGRAQAMIPRRSTLLQRAIPHHAAYRHEREATLAARADRPGRKQRKQRLHAVGMA
jgi:hypothetical protein